MTHTCGDVTMWPCGQMTYGEKTTDTSFILTDKETVGHYD